jgi:hypothetical protein
MRQSRPVASLAEWREGHPKASPRGHFCCPFCGLSRPDSAGIAELSDRLSSVGAMADDAGFSGVSAETPLGALEADICRLAAQISVATARLLALVGEFDERDGWVSVGVKSCAHWLSWRCHLGVHAAREQVRVARALRDLPVTRAEFAAGRLSYAKVRALTRVAEPDCEADLSSWR